MRWLITWATAAPIEATVIGLSMIFVPIFTLAMALFSVGLYRAVRAEMREQDERDGDWPQENSARSRRGWR